MLVTINKANGIQICLCGNSFVLHFTRPPGEKVETTLVWPVYPQDNTRISRSGLKALPIKEIQEWLGCKTINHMPHLSFGAIISFCLPLCQWLFFKCLQMDSSLVTFVSLDVPGSNSNSRGAMPGLTSPIASGWRDTRIPSQKTLVLP